MKTLLKILGFIIGIILAIMTDYSLILQHGRLHFIIMGGFLCYFLIDVIFYYLFLAIKVDEMVIDIKKNKEGIDFFVVGKEKGLIELYNDNHYHKRRFFMIKTHNPQKIYNVIKAIKECENELIRQS